MTDVSPSASSKEQALQNLVLDPDLERLEDLLTEFNLFDVLNIYWQEAPHSALLAWLLDPRASHGLRDYFLRAFLIQAATEAHNRRIRHIVFPANIKKWEFSNVEVAQERHHIDILILSETDKFVCLIENKIWTGEHSNQLTRYLNTIESEYPHLAPIPIFLTPDGRAPAMNKDAERYVPFGYAKIATLIERTLKARGSTINANVAGFLRQYTRALRRRIVNEFSDIDALALQIYRKHQLAIDSINNALRAEERALEAEKASKYWCVLDAAVKCFAPTLEPDIHDKDYHRFYSPDLEEIPQLREATGWTGTGRILLFEIWRREGQIVLQMGPGPDETRNQLYQLALRNNGFPGIDTNRSESINTRYQPLYVMPFATKDGAAIPNYEKDLEGIEQTISNFYNNDYWPIVNAIRKEFGLQPVSPASD